MAETQQEHNERIGGIAGLGAGVIAGAQVGTIFIPIPIVGTFFGALVGGVLGSEVGKTVGGALLDGVNAFTESLTGQEPRRPDTTGGAEPSDKAGP